jgi:hypothetical protein
LIRGTPLAGLFTSTLPAWPGIQAVVEHENVSETINRQAKNRLILIYIFGATHQLLRRLCRYLAYHISLVYRRVTHRVKEIFDQLGIIEMEIDRLRDTVTVWVNRIDGEMQACRNRD